MLQDRMMLFGVAALAAVATAGWMRQPQQAAAAPQALIPGHSFTAPADIALDPAYATAPPMATSVSATAVPVHSGVYRTTGAPVAKLSPGIVQRPAAPRAAQQGSRHRYADPELRDRTSAQREAEIDGGSRPATVVKQRSKMKSAAIIAGGAAAGAAVGGLAGGKKGAAIGAVSGGAAGVVYDRMTHKKEQPVQEYSRTSSAAGIDSDDDRSQGRSTAKSAVIIGGGAAAGAAIGGAAGGGKGAAIGALTGAGAGLVYDRMTKN